MESQLSLHLQNFNNRIKVMNQTNSRDLTLSAVDARNLHNDIFDLLIQIQSLTEIKQTQTEQDTITIQMDGGKFG